jgi:uncharacterized protein
MPAYGSLRNIVREIINETCCTIAHYFHAKPTVQWRNAAFGNRNKEPFMHSTALKTPLSDEEYDELDALLAAPEAMDVSMLEGFLTAVVIGPAPLSPEQWLARVWDWQDGTRALASATPEQCARAQVLVMRHYHHMAEWLAKDPASFEPIFECGPQWSPMQWGSGFLLGMQMDIAAWTPLLQGQPEWFSPFQQLGSSEAKSMDDDALEQAMDAVTPSVIKINGHFVEQRQPKRAPKVGRNDPCPCGSGKKYKKCCGDN